MMYIQLDTDQGSRRVGDVDDLSRFSVRVHGPTDSKALARPLGTLGRPEGGDYAWIDIETLRRISGRTGDEQWLHHFGTMVTYADSRGWLNAGGTALRAHLETGEADRTP